MMDCQVDCVLVSWADGDRNLVFATLGIFWKAGGKEHGNPPRHGRREIKLPGRICKRQFILLFLGVSDGPGDDDVNQPRLPLTDPPWRERSRRDQGREQKGPSWVSGYPRGLVCRITAHPTGVCADEIAWNATFSPANGQSPKTSLGAGSERESHWGSASSSSLIHHHRPAFSPIFCGPSRDQGRTKGATNEKASEVVSTRAHGRASQPLFFLPTRRYFVIPTFLLY
ncbi:hypothetical protein B0H67DRAFT_356731 [Lasiosphaeris hirsuta]|uniref:Uncharacterized protein n=1 Tax=Lasiosphaeris hirsuta TaxID=260670 RepID=A0AA39ZVZ6_9PEZI|nr:hypothetical protein B0H67DRAFT_356731 [Lasiosphaeris hirsuta]